MGEVLFRQGNIFEGSADLTVLPCSAKGTVSSATKTWLKFFELPSPRDMNLKLKLGEVSNPIPFTKGISLTRYVVFAASVLNYSSSEALESIGRRLGTLTATNPDLKIIETPLLGTGAGKLETLVAGKALYNGFKATSAPGALLYIFAFDHERYLALSKIVLDIGEEQRKKAFAAGPKIFISHSSEDEDVISALVDLFETALSLQPNDIRCTSLAGYRLRTGTHTSMQLREEIRTSELVVGVITPNSVRSSYVLLELGASWGLRKATFPLLARGANFDALPGPLRENHAGKLTSRVDVHQMIEDMISISTIGQSPASSARIEAKVEALVRVAMS